jgi:hypothetical protein
MSTKDALQRNVSMAGDLQLQVKAIENDYDQATRALEERKADLAKSRDFSRAWRAERAQLLQAAEEVRETAERCRLTRQALVVELEDSVLRDQEERELLEVVRAAHGGLLGARSLLSQVRTELEALSSEQAKKAALEAGGGDLPKDTVPEPTPQATGSPGIQGLWNEGGLGSDDTKVSDEIRNAFQSQVVLNALQRALSVRAAEIREGLRQLGFARSASSRTQDLCSLAERNHGDNLTKASSLDQEQKELMEEEKSDTTTLASLKDEHAVLQQRQAKLSADLNQMNDNLIETQAEHHAARELFEMAEQSKLELQLEFEDVGRELESQRTALNEHPGEADRRLTAMNRLAQRAEEQAQKTLNDLEQSQISLITFQQAHRHLQDANQLLTQHLGVQKDAHQNMKDEHEKMNLDLGALARNYLAELPPLPGAVQPSKPGSPSIVSVASQPPPSARQGGAPSSIAASKEIFSVPSSPSILESAKLSTVMSKQSLQMPEQQSAPLRHDPTGLAPVIKRGADPTGAGVLSAGGRILLSM